MQDQVVFTSKERGGVLIQTAEDFIEELDGVYEDLDGDTPLVFIQLEQHKLLVAEVIEEDGNLVIMAGKSAGRFGE